MDIKTDDEQQFKYRFNEMLVKFLRAISADDLNGRSFDVSCELFEALSFLLNVSEDRQAKLVEAVIADALQLARRDDAADLDEKSHMRIVRMSGKCLAERISGNHTQLAQAELRHHQALGRWYVEKKDLERRFRL